MVNEPRPLQPKKTSQSAPAIVIADDESHIRLVVGETFRARGFTVIEARDGEEALELVRNHLPDMVVTDLQMPYMNGVELCTQIAADPRTAHIPALLLTARGHIIDPAQMSKTVIRKTMAKPFSAKTLFENVQAIVNAARETDNTVGAISPNTAQHRNYRRPLTGEAA